MEAVHLAPSDRMKRAVAAYCYLLFGYMCDAYVLVSSPSLVMTIIVIVMATQLSERFESPTEVWTCKHESPLPQHSTHFAVVERCGTCGTVRIPFRFGGADTNLRALPIHLVFHRVFQSKTVRGKIPALAFLGMSGGRILKRLLLLGHGFHFWELACYDYGYSSSQKSPLPGPRATPRRLPSPRRHPRRRLAWSLAGIRGYPKPDTPTQMPRV